MKNKIALAGCGNVGTALIELLSGKRAMLEKKYGVTYEVTMITDLMKGTVIDPDGLDLDRVLEELHTKRTLRDLPQTAGTFEELLEKSEATMLAEATPTNVKTGEPGLAHLLAAFSRGISATTTNKGPLAVAMDKLVRTAKENGAKFRYEGVVMSGTPLINMLTEGMAGCTVTKAEGILNGTTNYMLTKMSEGMSYDEALKEAQGRGYAEADPTGDVEGWDAAAKVAILARIIYDKNISVDEVERTGITGVTREKIESAKKAGRVLKLIAGVENSGGIVRAYAAPKEVPSSHPLASINGATNAVTITTDNLGEVTLSGPGAGRRETGQALLTDLLAMAKKD